MEYVYTKNWANRYAVYIKIRETKTQIIVGYIGDPKVEAARFNKETGVQTGNKDGYTKYIITREEYAEGINRQIDVKKQNIQCEIDKLKKEIERLQAQQIELDVKRVKFT